MRNSILSTASLSILFLWALPLQGIASEADPGKLLDAVNAKTVKIQNEWVISDKDRGVTSKHMEVNSYVFSLEKKLLKVEFNQKIRSFENDQYIGTDQITGKVSIDSEQVDRDKIGVMNGRINIVCQGNKNCMDREARILEYNAKDEKTNEEQIKLPTFILQIEGADQSLAEQIIKDLKDLFALLAPPKPAGKAVAAESTEKQ